MEICFITPTPLLDTVATISHTHLALAHQYIEDNAYAEFYNLRSAAGDFVILDNSAYELGSSIQVDVLASIAKKLQPSAIFLPDKRFDREATIKMVVEAIELLRPITNAALLAVPQGNSLEEILLCYDQLMLFDVDGFGLYEEIGVVSGVGRRWDFLQYLEDSGRVREDKYYHMLGMEEDVQNIMKLAKYDWVNSIDSVKPISYGMYGVQFHPEHGPMVPYPHRQQNYFRQDGIPFNGVVIRNCGIAANWARFGRAK